MTETSVQPKIVTLDIETFPNVGHLWGLFNQNVSLNQLMESKRVASMAWKWLDSEELFFSSEFHDGKDKFIENMYQVLNEADIIVHYNGKKFDIPHINTEFVLAGYKTPSTFAQIDLLAVTRSKFKFPSNKLDYVSKVLLGSKKVQHEGHELWVKCMANDPKAWEKMKKYNIGDIVLTEKLYNYYRLNGWITNHPNIALFSEDETPTCESCGSTNLIKDGFYYTKVSKFQRRICKDCGKNSKDSKAIFRIKTAGIN